MIERSTNLDEFTRAVRRAVAEIPTEVVPDFARKIAFDALSSIVHLTPRDIGTAAHNWQVGVGSEPQGKLDPPAGQDAGSVVRGVLDRGRAALVNLPPFPVIYLTNNADHIEVLEYGQFVPPDPGPSKDKRPGRFGRILVSGGFSIQSPQGMVRVTALRLTNIIIRGVEQLRRQRLGGGIA